MERKFYKVDLKVDFKRKVELPKRWTDVQRCADEFNDRNSNGREIIILDIEDDIVKLLVAFEFDKDPSKGMLRLISHYLKAFCSLFGVTYESRKQYIRIQNSISLDWVEYCKFSELATCNAISASAVNEEELEEAAENNSGVQDHKQLQNSEDIKIPKRNFPYINSPSSRSQKDSKKEEIKRSYKDTLEELNMLVGLKEAKEKIQSLVSFIIKNNERYVDLNIKNPGLYYNVAISGARGAGKNILSRIIYKLFYQLGVIGEEKFINIDCRELWPGCTIDRLLAEAQSGVVFIDNVHNIQFSDKRGQRDFQSSFDEWFSTYKDNFVFVIAGEPYGITNFMKEHKVGRHINFHIHLQSYTDDEMLQLIRHFAAVEKYEVAADAAGTILKSLQYYRDIDAFENVHTAKLMVEQAILKKALNKEQNMLTAEDFYNEAAAEREKEEMERVQREADPFEELEKLIGLAKVKQVVKEISAYAAAQTKRKELGLEKEPVCLHMCFTGAPGTGKTSVARIMGRILKKLNILSKGTFVEAAREDIVGKYVGHTGPKTTDKIKEAEGGVLFLDEAYSLTSDSKVDFGYEAVTTIVKRMEDMRGNLVVIFAGYEKEMEKFLNMNPGLRHRIQFKLNFEDYNFQELFEIWMKFFKENNYMVDEAALPEMKKIAKLIYDNRTENFSNGRIMRKCFERAKMHQAIRIMHQKLSSKEDLMRIKLEDIKRLYEDEDISREMEMSSKVKSIGFIA
jgi:SpoVK/Ycf46/Vps4 family AAA+-type ATPase